MDGRIEIYGMLSRAVLEEIAEQALRDGAAGQEGGSPFSDPSEVEALAEEAQAFGTPFVLHVPADDPEASPTDVAAARIVAFLGVEDALRSHGVPHQLVAPFRANGHDYMSRVFDGAHERHLRSPVTIDAALELVSSPAP